MTATRAVSAWMFCRIKANVAATSTPLGPNTLVVGVSPVASSSIGTPVSHPALGGACTDVGGGGGGGESTYTVEKLKMKYNKINK